MCSAVASNNPFLNPTIAFIGAGNMARSLLAGLVPTHAVRVADPSSEQLNNIKTHWPEVAVFTANAEAIQGADVVVFAVKPQVMRPVAETLSNIIQINNAKKPMIVSVAAGITAKALEAWLGGDLAVVRCMPNTPALIRAGVAGLYANPQVSNDQRDLVDQMFKAVGVTFWFDEEAKLDAVTAISGSGPAYFFRVMEAMQAAGEVLGLSADESRQLVLHTALGAARLAVENGGAVSDLRQQVTSKGGTTEAALTVLNDGGLAELFAKATQAAATRAQELAQAN